MFKKLLSRIKDCGDKRRQAYIDRIDSFNDPLAKEVEWNPLSNTYHGFVHRKLLKTGNGNILFIPSMTILLFDMVFIATGLVIMWHTSLVRPPFTVIISHPINTFLQYIYHLPQLLSSNKVWAHLFGSVFLIVGLVALFYSLRPIVFNSLDRVYTKGFRRKLKIPFRDIRAIQVITNSGNDPETRTIYELNLVLRDKSRVHVIGHPKKTLILENGKKVSRMLFIPVWDVTTLSVRTKLAPQTRHLTKRFNIALLGLFLMICTVTGLYLFYNNTDANEDSWQEISTRTGKLDLSPCWFQCVKITLKSGEAVAGHVFSVSTPQYLVLHVIGGTVKVEGEQIDSIKRLPEGNAQFDTVLSDKDLYRSLDQIKSADTNFTILLDYSDEEYNIYTNIIWGKNLKRAKRRARLLNQKVFVEFYQPGNKKYARFNDEIFADETIKLLIDRNFVPVRVKRTEKDILREFGVTQCPHFVFLDSAGNIIRSVPGNMTKTEFTHLLSSTLEGK